MIKVFHRYRTLFFIGAVLILATAIYFLAQRQDMIKLPTRGVFVINSMHQIA